ncbi:copper amine oxidase N-terminal domain-containing protein [Thermincola ferriacetica]
MKRAFVLILPFLAIVFNTSFAWAQTTIKINVNGEPVSFPDVQPYLNACNHILVPVRFVGKFLGAQVNWDGNDKKVTIERGCTTIILKIGENKAVVNSETLFLETAATLHNGRTMVPLRFICETLGAGMDWEPQTKTAKVLVNNGYNIPDKTDLTYEIPPAENPEQTDIGILISLEKDLDKQLADVQAILFSKFSREKVREIVDFLSLKNGPAKDLPIQRWRIGEYIITAGPGADTSLIKVTVTKSKK